MRNIWIYCPILIQCALSFSIDRRQALNGFLGSSIYSSNSLTPISKQEPLKISSYENNNDEGKEEVGILQETTTNDIYFYGPVSQRSCFELKNMLKNMEFKMYSLHLQYKIDPPPIHLHIQSQGGSLYHTLYIIDLIQNMNTPVYTYIDGFAASAATLISVVGKKRFMTKHSLMLIHQLSGSDSGKFNELQDQMNNMKVLMNIIAEIYLTHTNVTNHTLNYLLQKDLWLDSETCLKYGLVDEII